MVLALTNACGLSLALYHDSLVAVVLFIGIFGFTMGGIMSTYPVMSLSESSVNNCRDRSTPLLSHADFTV